MFIYNIYITLILFYLRFMEYFFNVQVFCSRCESGNENSARHGIKINQGEHAFLRPLPPSQLIFTQSRHLSHRREETLTLIKMALCAPRCRMA